MLLHPERKEVYPTDQLLLRRHTVLRTVHLQTEAVDPNATARKTGQIW